MIKLLFLPLFFLLSCSGFYVSGVLGIWEVLIELAFMAGLYFLHWWKEDTEPEKANLLVFLAFKLKDRLFRKALWSDSITSILAIVAIGIFIGWLTTLVWYSGQSWEFLLTREIKETILDIVIFLPLLFLCVWDYRRIANHVQDAIDEAEDRLNQAIYEYEQDRAALLPPTAFGAGQVMPGFEAMKMLIVRAYFVLLFLVLYVLGAVFEETFQIAFLEYFRDWAIQQS